MTESEKLARAELVRRYGDLTDPKYAPDPQKAELLLRKAAREIWREHGQNLPGWVKKYVESWSRKPSSGEGDDGE